MGHIDAPAHSEAADSAHERGGALDFEIPSAAPARFQTYRNIRTRKAAVSGIGKDAAQETTEQGGTTITAMMM